MLDKFLAPNTPEAEAYYHLTSVSFYSRHYVTHVAYFSENGPAWHTNTSAVDESLMSDCASYSAFNRYIGGKDLFLLPRTRIDLESIL
jgi:hypothetical protein